MYTDILNWMSPLGAGGLFITIKLQECVVVTDDQSVTNTHTRSHCFQERCCCVDLLSLHHREQWSFISCSVPPNPSDPQTTLLHWEQLNPQRCLWSGEFFRNTVAICFNQHVHIPLMLDNTSNTEILHRFLKKNIDYRPRPHLWSWNAQANLLWYTEPCWKLSGQKNKKKQARWWTISPSPSITGKLQPIRSKNCNMVKLWVKSVRRRVKTRFSTSVLLFVLLSMNK